MPQFGYTLSSEEHGPGDLVRNAERAEAAGFDFLSISDHYHPWVSAQGHSPFVWSVLGAVAASTERMGLAVGVTCPIMRVHPAVVAQAAATTALLAEGRFTLGVGTGEALNEHITSQRWPRPEIRVEMLEEAVQIIRQLWSGETVDFCGAFYEVHNARLFDVPPEPPDVIVSGFGSASIDLAAMIGDGYWGHAPDRAVIDRFLDAGGRGPRYAQLNLCWDPDRATARKTVHQIWPNAGIPGQLSQDLPTWTHFEQAAQLVSEDVAVADVPCGPDLDPVLESVQLFLDAGYDHLYFHQIGPNQDGFLQFWTDRLQPVLRSLGS